MPPTPRRATRSIAPIPTAATLRASALHYLARYAASSGNLRRVLLRRIASTAQHYPDLTAAQLTLLRAEAEKIVTFCIDRKYLDDDTYATAQAKRARAQGKSARLVMAKLQQKGLTQTQIAAALAAADTPATDADAENASPEAAEYRAALRCAQRKKLGPYRAAPGDALQNRRDFATLARAGFSSAIAQKILRCTNADDDL